LGLELVFFFHYRKFFGPQPAYFYSISIDRVIFFVVCLFQDVRNWQPGKRKRYSFRAKRDTPWEPNFEYKISVLIHKIIT